MFMVQELSEYAARVYCSSGLGRHGQGKEKLAREKYQNPKVDKPNEGLQTDNCLGVGRVRFLSWRRKR
jgi:hypothetical protein